MRSHRSSMVLALLAAVAVVACSRAQSIEPPAPRDRDSVVVASFDFAESELLAELYATALEAHGFPVTRRLNLGSRELLQPALVQRQIDFLPEYVGTALTFLTLGHVNVTSHSPSMHRALKRTLSAKGVTAFDYSSAQDKNGVVVTADTAEKYDLERISDLAPHASDLVFGGPPECEERPLCLAGLEETYGLQFESFLPLDVGGPATLAALEGHEIDVGLLFTTDPNLSAEHLVLLEDDRNLQPAENVVPVVVDSVAQRYGSDFENVVNGVTNALTTPKLRSLNVAVQLEDRDPHDTALEWLQAEGLL